ncbi:hypothetical protein [Paenibacillus sp. YN15]|uniref:hypothetical protein n=1 Tax=Paenibacillus sp. YN15 TaxID=1742774 RepID=UPI000DCCD18D|nr:hypothetical protein [Paenibacillus sp. YN15]RAU92252.1 hypothetical protein DQG13_27830 [Paenibacillus sp. YN15]
MKFILPSKTTMEWRSVIRKAVAVAAAAACLTLGGWRAGTAGIGPLTAAAVPEGALLTIDGYPVPKEEFQLFLQEERALTAAYFSKTYGAEADAEFWKREFAGQTPNDYGKKKALNKLLTVKMQAILLHERGLAGDISYGKLAAEREKVNARRAEQLRADEIFYGLTEFDEPTYYAYIAAQRLGDLVQSQYELTAPADQQLKELYEKAPERYAAPPVYTCRISYYDGGEETVVLTAGSISKEDSYGQLIYQKLGSISPGETLPQVNYLGREAAATLLSVEQPEVGFGQARESLRREWAQQELWALLQQRIAAAAIKLDQRQYDAIGFD